MNHKTTNFPPFACASWVVMFIFVMRFSLLCCNAGNSIQISPASGALTPNQIQQFSASLHDQFGNPLSPPKFTWSRVSGVGLVSEKGLYYGGTVPDSAMLQVTGGGATSSVPVSVVPPAAGVPGLTARYYASTNLLTPLLMRIDPFVNFDWGTNSPGPTVPADNFTAIWTGQIMPVYSENYTFYLTADDGARLWLGDQLLVSNWQSNSPLASCTLAMQAGQKIRLRLEFYSATGNARAQLAWKSVHQPLQVVPQSALSSDDGSYDLGGILEEYWTGVTGNTISNLTNSATFQGPPTGRELLTTFEIPRQGWTTNFGTLARGYLVPSTTGDYTLAVSGGNQVQLFLSTNDNPFLATQVAYVTNATSFENYTQYPGQQSASQHLLAGQRYYLQLLQQQGTDGAGHFSVAWKPSGGSYALLTGTNLAPYDAAIDLGPTNNILELMAASHPIWLYPPQRVDFICFKIAGSSWPFGPKYFMRLTNDCTPSLVATNSSGVFTNLAGVNLDPAFMQEMGLYYQIVKNPNYPTLYNPTIATQLVNRIWAELTNTCSQSPANWLVNGNWLATSETTAAVGYALEGFRSSFSTAQRQLIVNELITNALQPVIDQVYAATNQWDEDSSNWTPHCNGGFIIGALAVAGDQPAIATRILSDAIPSARYALQRETANNGAWWESPNYHGTAFKPFFLALAGLNDALGTDFGLSETPGLANDTSYLLMDTAVNNAINGSLVTTDPLVGFMYGDGTYTTGVIPTLDLSISQYAWNLWVAKRFGNTVYTGMRQLDSGSVWDMIWYDPRSTSATNLPNSMLFRGDTTVFPSENILTMRNSWSNKTNTFVGFKGGSAMLDSGHKQLDPGTFSIEALGHAWAVNLGSENYTRAVNDFNTGRFTYYRNRAEGHNTLVINPSSLVSEPRIFGGTFSPYPDEDPNITSDIILYNVNSTNGSTSAVADLSPVYRHLVYSRIWRGVQLATNNTVLVQDELQTATPAEVYWFMHILATDTVTTNYAGDAHQLLLSKANGDSLWLKYLGTPTNAVFTVMPARPLLSSLNAAGLQDSDNTNTYLKIALHFTGLTNAQFAVYMVPLPSGQSPSGTVPTLTALTNWGATAQPVTSPAFVTVPSSPPTISYPRADATGTNLLFSVSTVTYQTYILCSATNLSAPATWMPVSTNAGTGGQLTNIVPISRTKQFFRYQVR